MTPDELSRRADAGDHRAQDAIGMAIARSGLAGDVPVTEAISLARIYTGKAAKSGLAQYVLNHAGVILIDAKCGASSQAGGEQRNKDFAVALAMLDALADQGHRRAQTFAFALAADLPPSITASAQELKQSVYVAPLSERDRQREAEGVEGVSDLMPRFIEGNC